MIKKNSSLNTKLKLKWEEALESSADDNDRLDRGMDYFFSGAVEDLRIKNDSITAKVEGNYSRYYKIKIEPEHLSDKQIEVVMDVIKNNPDIGQEISSGELSLNLMEALEQKNVNLIPESFDGYYYDCNCPDDAYICKHIAAVFYAIGEKISENPFILFEMNGITLQKLTGLPQVNSDNLEKFVESTTDPKEKLLNTMIEKADKPILESLLIKLANESSENFRCVLNYLEKNVALEPLEASQSLKEKFVSLWREAKPLIEELDEYGGGDDEQYEEVYDILEGVTDALETEDLDKITRMNFIDEAFQFIKSGNSGMVDELDDIIHSACYDEEDWRYLASKFEVLSDKYEVQKAMKIYRKLGDNQKYLDLRLKFMEYGFDYYDLVTFYEEEGNHEKAVALAIEGKEKGAGNISPLVDFLINEAKNNNNRELYLKLEFDKALKGFNYSSYKHFKSVCTNEEWVYYEPQILKQLNKAYERDQMLIFIDREEYPKALEILNKETPYGIFHIDYDIAEKLKTRYPKDIVNYYIRALGNYNTAKDRKAYADQAKLALRIKEIYLNNLNDPASWRELLINIKNSNKRRPALQEEFSKIIPEWKNI